MADKTLQEPTTPRGPPRPGPGRGGRGRGKPLPRRVETRMVEKKGGENRTPL